MKTAQKIILTILVIIVTGCVSKPTPDEISRAYYGREMNQAECERIAEKVMLNRSWKDPGSVILKYGYCRKGYKRDTFTKTKFGYIIEGTANAKNSFGGYTGPEPFYIIMRNGRALFIGVLFGKSMHQYPL